MTTPQRRTRREIGRSTNDDDATEPEDRRPEPPDDDARANAEEAPATPGSRGPWLAATGTLAFLATASGLGDPAKAVIAASSLGALGLSLLGVGPSAAGASILFVGVPALAGGIHRLGRLGPDVPARASTPAPAGRGA